MIPLNLIKKEKRTPLPETGRDSRSSTEKENCSEEKLSGKITSPLIQQGEKGSMLGREKKKEALIFERIEKGVFRRRSVPV